MKIDWIAMADREPYDNEDGPFWVVGPRDHWGSPIMLLHYIASTKEFMLRLNSRGPEGEIFSDVIYWAHADWPPPPWATSEEE